MADYHTIINQSNGNCRASRQNKMSEIKWIECEKKERVHLQNFSSNGTPQGTASECISTFANYYMQFAAGLPIKMFKH